MTKWAGRVLNPQWPPFQPIPLLTTRPSVHFMTGPDNEAAWEPRGYMPNTRHYGSSQARPVPAVMPESR